MIKYNLIYTNYIFSLSKLTIALIASLSLSACLFGGSSSKQAAAAASGGGGSSGILNASFNGTWLNCDVGEDNDLLKVYVIDAASGSVAITFESFDPGSECGSSPQAANPNAMFIEVGTASVATTPASVSNWNVGPEGVDDQNVILATSIAYNLSVITADAGDYNNTGYDLLTGLMNLLTGNETLEAEEGAPVPFPDNTQLSTVSMVATGGTYYSIMAYDAADGSILIGESDGNGNGFTSETRNVDFNDELYDY